MDRIERFDQDDSTRFLSNFAPSPITWMGMEFSTVEHAFQASKTVDAEQQFRIQQALTPGKAKRMGQSVSLRPDWDQIKVDTMFTLLRLKFAIPRLREQLLATGDVDIIEGNDWGDTFWGVCRGVGQNILGELLMQVRDECRKADELARG